MVDESLGSGEVRPLSHAEVTASGIHAKKVQYSRAWVELGEALAEAIVKRDAVSAKRIFMRACLTPEGLERARNGLLGAALAELVQVTEIADGPFADGSAWEPGKDNLNRLNRDRLRVDTRMKLVGLLFGELAKVKAAQGETNVQVNVGLDGILAQVQARRAAVGDQRAPTPGDLSTTAPVDVPE